MNRHRPDSEPSMTDQGDPGDQHYRIGAVARLTGLSVDRLRAWERRYGVVATRRSESMGRIYSRSDVERLDKLRRLVELGNAIGSVAHLSDEQLADRLRVDEGLPEPRTRHPRPAPPRPADDAPAVREGNVFACGPLVAALLEGVDLEAEGLRLRRVFRQREALFEHLGSEPAHAVVLELKSAHDEDADALIRHACEHPSAHFVVIVGFARRGVLARLSEAGLSVLRHPVLAEELLLLLARGTPAVPTPSIPSELPDVLPARRFLDEELLELSGRASEVECECPEHLSVLINSLNAFEQYCSECKVRAPDDAELHAYLQRVTAHARALMEEGLENLIEIEGLAPDSN